MTASNVALTSMDDTGGLRSFGTIPYCPLPNFIRTGCEEAYQVERFPHGHNDLW